MSCIEYIKLMCQGMNIKIIGLYQLWTEMVKNSYIQYMQSVIISNSIVV